MSDAKIGFEMRKVRIPLENILPIRQIGDSQKSSERYRMIQISLKEVGLVEPLMVHPQKNNPDKYLLLDGHLRLFALKEMGETSVECLLATDDESFTYNVNAGRKVRRVAVQKCSTFGCFIQGPTERVKNRVRVSLK